MIQEHRRENNLPISASDRLESIGLCAFPVIELTYNVYLGGIWSPLTEHPVAFCITMETIIHVVIHSLGKRPVYRHLFLKAHDHLMTSVDDILVGSQPLVMIVDHLFLLCHIDMILI